MNNRKNFIRALLALFQAVIDAAVYRMSFSLVVLLWFAGKTPREFDFDVIAFFTWTMIAVFYFSSLYSFRTWILWDEIKAILKSSALILPVTVLYLYSQNFDLSRFVIASGTIIFVPLCIITRWLFRRILFALGILNTNIIILGAGKTGEIFAEKIVSHPFTACKVVGFLDDDPHKQGKTIAGFPVLGRLEDFIDVYMTHDIDEAAVAISTATRSLLTHILDIVEFHVRQIHYIPDMYMLTTFSSSVRDVEGMPVIVASQGLLSPFNRAVKSVTEYVVALFAVVIFSPVMAVAAVKIKLDDGGKVFSPLERTGLNANTFSMYKFRT
ncbi:MAG: sugar transferase, partial [Synergistaceae bacterium]|nr:sugar transferase [Synergistaceae bacterium]